MEIQNEPQRQRRRRATHHERKRAARACNGCRRQKEKCDGGVPCRRCFRLGRKCEFSNRVARDSTTASASATAAAPAATALVPQPAAAEAITNRTPPASGDEHQDSIALSQRVAYLERIVQHYAGEINLDPQAIRYMAEHVDQQKQQASTGRSPPRPAVSASLSSVGSDLVGVDEENFSIKPLENNVTHYSGEFSHWNFSMRIKQWIDKSVPHDGLNQTPNSTDFKEYYRAEELQSPSTVAASLFSLPPRCIANFLVDSFFKHAEANYFFVERDWLRERLDTAYERATSLSRRDIGSVCVIFAVLAIGTQHAYLETYIEGSEEPARSYSPNDSGLFSEDTVGVMFYQQACRLLPDVITISSLESVQSCLLIGIYTLPLDASGMSYIYLNLAIKLAIQNGMHRKYPDNSLDASVRETRNRVWWTAYTIERRVGIFHGRPISISALDVDVDLPVDKTEVWPSTTSIHTAQFLATLHLNQVLDKMSHEISILRTYSKHQITSGLGRLTELHRELLDWWATLPDALGAKESITQLSVTRPGIHLRLEYCLIRIFVGRAFIFPKEISRNSISDGSPASQDTAAPLRNPSFSSKSQPRAILVADCIEASLAVMDTCRTLRDTIGLARASYTEFSACRAGLLVIITQCLQRKTTRFRRALRDGLSMLKEMSASCESARSEMSLIEAFERVITKLDTAAAEGRVDSEYSRFKKWEQLWKSDTSSMDRLNEGTEGIHMPLAPQSVGPRRLSEGPPQKQGTVPMPLHTPFFGMDGHLASFPQTMDEFSSFLTYSFGPGHEYIQGTDIETTWMGSL